MLKPESLIAGALMVFSVYLMWHATVLPIGWVEGQGPGGGVFPFWISLVMLLCSGGILVRSVLAGAPREPFFTPGMFGPLAAVVLALVVTTLAMPILGTYIAIPAFMIWYMRFFGGRSWTVTLSVTVGTVLILFFFFEVLLRSLLPKGITEPLFLPLYQIFF